MQSNPSKRNFKNLSKNENIKLIYLFPSLLFVLSSLLLFLLNLNILYYISAISLGIILIATCLFFKEMSMITDMSIIVLSYIIILLTSDSFTLNHEDAIFIYLLVLSVVLLCNCMFRLLDTLMNGYKKLKISGNNSFSRLLKKTDDKLEKYSSFIIPLYLLHFIVMLVLILTIISQLYYYYTADSLLKGKMEGIYFTYNMQEIEDFLHVREQIQNNSDKYTDEDLAKMKDKLINNYKNIHTLLPTKIDSYYFSCITFFTIGYGDIIPLGNFARKLVIVVSFLSFFTTIFLIPTMISIIFLFIGEIPSQYRLLFKKKEDDN